MKLEVRNLNTFFEDTQILKNVNMDVPENSVTALIGPSAAVNLHSSEQLIV